MTYVYPRGWVGDNYFTGGSFSHISVLCYFELLKFLLDFASEISRCNFESLIGFC